MKTLKSILLLSCFMVLSLFAAKQKPNVVLVITDDQGYGDLSCHGNPVVKTPEIDKLHGESVRLTDFHVSPTCAPTRGALMSGHFTNRAGPWHTIMGRSFLFEGEKTLGGVFAENGYTSGMFGKWHLGDNYPFRPEDRGFTEVVRHGGGGVGQTPDAWDNAYFDDHYWHNGVLKPYEGYCTDVFFGEATRFIDESIAAKKPFFAYVATNAPHGPFVCPDKYWKPYLEELKKIGYKKPEALAIFFGMIANIDENVGKLRAHLEEKGVADNTIFIFMTDNGTASGGRLFNAGMRGNKGAEFDGGHRVPFFVHWPEGKLEGGVDVDRLTAHIDVLPTLIELCGLQPLEDDYKVDGKSLVPLLENPQAEWPERVLVTDSQRVRDPVKWKNCATMTDRWRLINGKGLYDIKADPGQKTDLAKKHPEVVSELRAAYDAWWADISPVFETDARIIVGNDAENPLELTAHDWLTENGIYPPWNQTAIRQGLEVSGVWAIHVETAGKYKVSLRRWPATKDAPINAELPEGAEVQGLDAYRNVPGVSIGAKQAGLEIAGKKLEKPVEGDAKSVDFELELEQGDAYLGAWFLTGDEGKKVGAYYVDVEKL
ncbi:MAG: arylsulfatase [Verrucomicrobiota bacterium JB025]|nr:arylsulfatase [Verrucomicrobiota bacterium JB025]